MWHGVYPAVTTQFHADFSVDIEATLKHVDVLIDEGVHGLIMLGSVGENTALEPHEKREVLKSVVEHVAGRVPVLSGVAEYTTALACRYAADAEKLGANGLMVLPCMVYKADAREAMTHFREVAKASSLPIMIYNNPVAYTVDVTPAMLQELADEPKFVAVKESSDNVRRITDIRNLLGNRYTLLSGVDDLALESILLGAEGWVSGLVNAFPAENRALWELATAGRWQEALDIYRWYTPLLHLDTHTKLVQYIKLCMAEVGYGSELTRPPRLPLVGEERTRITKLIRDAIANRPQLDALLSSTAN
ncbi:dihydrodipicolinate synthetase [Planctopirus limnophila DSM 3776]|uniref:Dihydrodipicolinate synthetase n=1 Tax=Planctopirus limnophila (strain ATCC 43296 / DSM 3776 / IFAM 1008 / Mu 290) TaxID=521674 RepID=D5SQS5_PLAL2|nr:dihydrodipicolinate synthase family protein [Planctopirus limnophila]ADG68537.1 dihydrodipicolinate synthetase [Planctopirus limnophila DSM 3776]